MTFQEVVGTLRMLSATAVEEKILPLLEYNFIRAVIFMMPHHALALKLLLTSYLIKIDY